ncbi:hypothetical protein KIL84_014143 [Mauremys mutica]|uniref:Uncharacterized protein n=1 Tax=Mauremys mutica TaxID=74926 RepID=A0A9D3XPM5_9SAUR|nr:hypothetical protein KIL84_014143 [Mauremys mutica]
MFGLAFVLHRSLVPSYFSFFQLTTGKGGEGKRNGRKDRKRVKQKNPNLKSQRNGSFSFWSFVEKSEHCKSTKTFIDNICFWKKAIFQLKKCFIQIMATGSIKALSPPPKPAPPSFTLQF